MQFFRLLEPSPVNGAGLLKAPKNAGKLFFDSRASSAGNFKRVAHKAADRRRDIYKKLLVFFPPDARSDVSQHHADAIKTEDAFPRGGLRNLFKGHTVVARISLRAIISSRAGDARESVTIGKRIT